MELILQVMFLERLIGKDYSIMIVKEYLDENTKIRIHDDFCLHDEKKKEVEKIIISLFIKNISGDVKMSCKA